MKTKLQLSILAATAFVSLGAAASAQQAPQAPNMTFFVTSAGPGKGADLGGLAGADAHCQQLATTVGAGGKTWHAYLSTNAANQGGPVNARDRIGKGPWQNSKGVVVANDVDDLHSANNNLNQQTALTERGTMVAGVGMTPNQHDAMTGSQADGRAFPANLNLTCNNWASSTFGSTMLGHIDRTPKTPANLESWNAAHMSRSCSQPDLIATGGNGLFYCFAAQ
ncbi:MAG TPA: lectin [Xanthobacteraceae bacterium]|jgi:hypothetical protein|nr:lectin [Xanthobacteraceae bacterium]